MLVPLGGMSCAEMASSKPQCSPREIGPNNGAGGRKEFMRLRHFAKCWPTVSTPLMPAVIAVTVTTLHNSPILLV